MASQAQTKKKTTAKQTKTTQVKKKKASTSKKTQKEISTPSIKGLKNEREQIKKQTS